MQSTLKLGNGRRTAMITRVAALLGFGMVASAWTTPMALPVQNAGFEDNGGSLGPAWTVFPTLGSGHGPPMTPNLVGGGSSHACQLLGSGDYAGNGYNTSIQQYVNISKAGDYTWNFWVGDIALHPWTTPPGPATVFGFTAELFSSPNTPVLNFHLGQSASGLYSDDPANNMQAVPDGDGFTVTGTTSLPIGSYLLSFAASGNDSYGGFSGVVVDNQPFTAPDGGNTALLTCIGLGTLIGGVRFLRRSSPA
jgi:hypothetical protein